MQISSNTNNDQALQAQKNNVTHPVQPTEPTYSNKEIYEASQGNITRAKDGDLALTAQGETNLNNAKDVKESETEQAAQVKKDAQRDVGVDYLAASAKKSQVEIYLAVATDDQTESNNQTADLISNLRDVQKQNNAIQSYTAYQEAQKNTDPALY